VTLDRLVQKYIDYEERILRERERRRSVPPKTVTSQPPRQPAPSENNASREETPSPPPPSFAPPVPISEEPTLYTLLGERHPEWMLLPQEPRVGPSLPGTEPPTSAAKPPAKIVKAPAPPRTVRHRVQPGESFIALARHYQTTPYDIRRWNKLPYDHLLKIGETLLIHPGERTPPEKLREALRRERFGYYTVKKGDSLIGIARRFKVRLREILELNDLKRRSHLKVGQKLMLPLKAEKIARILAKEKRFKYASDKRFKHKLRVVATAYTSHRNQTDKTPFLAAWNNRIRPGMKIIAVSPDLIRKYGITNGTKVKISGLPGIYTVRDKMHRRMRNHIDIYMGTNRRKALRWGRRRVILYW
jgi:LysM repeat protein